MRKCLDAHFGQIVCDKDGVVDWCIVLVEMPLTRFEECWPLPMESHTEFSRVYDNFKCPYEKSLETYRITPRRYLVQIIF